MKITRECSLEKLVSLGYAYDESVTNYISRKHNNKIAPVRLTTIENRLCIKQSDISVMPYLDVLWILNNGDLPLHKKVVCITDSLPPRIGNLRIIDSGQISHNVFSTAKDSGLCAINLDNGEYVYMYNNQETKIRDKDWRVVLNKRLKALNYWNLNYTQLVLDSAIGVVFKELGLEEGSYCGIIDFENKCVVDTQIEVPKLVLLSHEKVQERMINRLIQYGVPLFEPGMKPLEDECATN